MLQHATFSVPARKEGYAVDDSARALVFAIPASRLWPDRRLQDIPRRLLSFLLLMQEDDGRMHNFMDFSRRIVDESASGDHMGRAVWAAGKVLSSNVPPGQKASARLLFDRALPWLVSSTWPRTKAYACLGVAERLRAEPDDSNLKLNLKKMADSLVETYRRNKVQGWNWFEEAITYDNARLSQALFAAYTCLKDETYLKIAAESLEFLSRVTEMKDTFVPVGNQGWYMRGSDRPMYDQQPIEAGSMVEAAVLARDVTGSESYARTARNALGWFFGLNTKSVTVYDESNGACYDGINPSGLNQNQGAESTLAYLLAVEALLSKEVRD